MSNFVQIAEETGDRYLAALEAGQENFLNYVATLAQWTPGPPATPGLSVWRAVSDAGFAFSEKLLAQQKGFADRFIARTEGTGARPARSARPVVVRSSRKKTGTASKASPGTKS